MRTAWRSLSLRLMLGSAALVIVVAAAVHVLWRASAERHLDEVIAALNLEILQGVAGVIRGVSEDVVASQNVMRALFERGRLAVDRPREVEQFLVDLVAAKPLYSWAQIGFPNGDFWGANRIDDETIRFVVRRWEAEPKKARRTTTYYRRDAGGWRPGRTETEDEDYFAPARAWYQAAMAERGKIVWSEVYLYSTTRRAGIDSALALTLPESGEMVLGIGFELQHLSRYLGRLPIAAKGRVFLADAKGRVIASSGPVGDTGDAGGTVKLATLGETPDPLLKLVATQEAASAGAVRRARDGDGQVYLVTLQTSGYADWNLGTVVPERVFLEGIRRSQNLLLLALAAFAVAVAGGAAWLSRRWIARPIADLSAAAAKVAEGDFDARVAPGSTEEFGRLSQAFNQMAAGLKEREREKDIFGRVVSPEVREKLLTGHLQLGGETCWVAVIFSDIRGFSAISESLPAQDVVALLNEYMTEMTQAIKPFGGYINNFIGDAIVAVFGAPIPHADIEWRAVSAAIAMRQRLAALNERRRQRGEMEIASGIGISTGEAVAGQIGSLDRLLYTVIGDAVNLAARLETMTKEFAGNPILMNGQTAKALQGREGLHLVDRGVMTIKGRAKGIEVYSLNVDAGTADA